LLQDTIARLHNLLGCGAPIVISNNEHRFLVAEQLNQLGVRPAVQILEPIGRNTAPAVAVAALHVCGEDPDGLLAVLPSDHVIANAIAFREAVLTAARLAERDFLVTFGVRPTQPHTGYGYIELGEALPGEASGFRIQRFVEKPDLQRARQYLESGRFLWNSGMFVFSAQRFLEELSKSRPDILEGARKALAAAVRDLDFLRLDTAFAACPAESIDYAVMEKTPRGAVVRADIGWNDVGSWTALWDIAKRDEADNATHGDVHLADVAGCYIWSDSRLVFALGARNLIIVETADAVLVADRSRTQDVKTIVESLDKEARSEHVSHTRVYRPWGYYETIDTGSRFQVKRIMVKPGQALSLQMHRQRAEHWVVVSGRARVTRDENVYDLAENESTFIPLGTKHRLENPTDQPLYLIEVQSGAYLGEDDIIRFEDKYKRS
jgi:mannose-1-phosphate guanylyltransferase/mannose-6-phosphate isomerase